MLYAATPTSSRVIAAGGRMTRAFSAQLLEMYRRGQSNHKKMTIFRMAALECVQRYLAGQGLSHLLGWSEDDFAEQTYDVSRPHAAPLHFWRRTG
jgi:hypothetical protein